MASKRVRAIAEGYYGLSLVAVGTEFSMDEKNMRKDGKGNAILPNWVESAEKPAKKEAAEAGPKESAPAQEKAGAGKDVI